MKLKMCARLLLLAAALGFTACSESDGTEDTEYTNWQARNNDYFTQALRQAAAEVATAKAAYGDSWEEHCDWRVYRSYAKSATAEASASDSIAVRVLHKGTGSGYPYYTDSVRVNFIGRLMPNSLSTDLESRTKGLMFAYTGTVKDSAVVFSPEYCSPALLAVSNSVEGFTTALMRMRIGDRWRVYIPQALGYGSSATTTIPAYSTLIYDMELKAYYRKGVVAGPWQ